MVSPPVLSMADSPPQRPETPIAHDENSTDSEDGFEDGSSTKSVTSSVWTFHKENGRTYHGYRAGMYHFPNDPTETERLDFQYSVFQHALQDVLHFAPLDDPANIIDIGTGTGTWAIQMGDAYPNAKVEGTDLSPIQSSAVPANVHFIIDDAEQDDWAVNENHYDLIHTRILMGCFRDFRQIVRQGFKHTKPGGWMESQDIMMLPACDDGTMPIDWPFKEWSEHIDDASMEADRPLRIANKLKRWYTEAGFVDVQEKIIKLPINNWPRDPALKLLGKWWADNLLIGLQGFSLGLLSRVLMWEREKIEGYLVNVRQSITDRRVHAYHKMYVVWGRKPIEAEMLKTASEPVLPPQSNSASHGDLVSRPSNLQTTNSGTTITT